jgi:amino acid adenylation domain-containing protein
MAGEFFRLGMFRGSPSKEENKSRRSELGASRPNQRSQVGATGETIIDLIDRSCNRNVSSVAVSFGEKNVTYRELRRRSDRIAAYLNRRGVKPSTPVGILVERSDAMLVGLLGILKAGAYYVPLDPSYPEERLRFMLQDSGLKLLLTERPFVERPSIQDYELIFLDAEFEEGSQVREHDPVALPKDSDLAYVIYTSGSTGQPKGVMVTHRGLLNVLQSMTVEPGIEKDDILLAVTTLSFDIAALELLMPLLVGARIVLAPRTTVSNAHLLAGMLETSRATLMQATPTTWKMLLRAGWRGSSRLKALCGGEALSRDLADDLLSRVGSLWNLYGPTETTIWSTVARIAKDGKPITIGSPVANTSIFILDEQGHPVPEGAPGELYIGGMGVASGYWRRPELTADRFVPNHFDDSSSRLYRTGDEVRTRENGAIEFLGRQDDQVKVRGHRIELREIEATLRRHPAVLDGLVITQPEGDSDHRLVAYVLRRRTVSDATPDLRTYLRQYLPEYMIPTQFVDIESFPLTPNGKVDRKALPVAPSLPLELSGSDAPKTESERKLARIFEDQLGVRHIGRTGNFFELGGHSLLAVRLFSEIERVFGKKLSLGTIFEVPTVEQLAALLETEFSSSSALVKIQEGQALAPFFCVHPLGSNVLRYRTLARLLSSEQPFYGLQPHGIDGTQAPYTRVEIMAEEFLKEIRSVQAKGPYYLGGWSFGGVVAFEMARQLHAQNQQVGLVALLDTFLPGCPSHFPERSTRKNLTFYADRLLGEMLVCPPRQRWSYLTKLGRGVFVSKANGQFTLGRRKGRDSLLQVLDSIEQACVLAEQAYVPQYYPGKLTQFWCSGWGLRSYEDRRLAWCDVAGGGLEIQVVPGGHQSMFEPPHVSILADKIRPYLPCASGSSHFDSHQDSAAHFFSKTV